MPDPLCDHGWKPGWDVCNKKDIRRTDVAGKYLYAGHRVCQVSVVMHGVILLIGVLKIIL